MNEVAQVFNFYDSLFCAPFGWLRRNVCSP